MKDFDLDMARSGAEVVDEEGNTVRILCFDRPSESSPLVAMNKDGGVSVYDIDGVGFSHRKLYMAPVKRTGWLNIYRTSIEDPTAHMMYNSEKKAVERATPDIVATAKIEWEE